MLAALAIAAMWMSVRKIAAPSRQKKPWMKIQINAPIRNGTACEATPANWRSHPFWPQQVEQRHGQFVTSGNSAKRGERSAMPIVVISRIRQVSIDTYGFAPGASIFTGSFVGPLILSFLRSIFVGILAAEAGVNDDLVGNCVGDPAANKRNADQKNVVPRGWAWAFSTGASSSSAYHPFRLGFPIELREWRGVFFRR